MSYPVCAISDKSQSHVIETAKQQVMCALTPSPRAGYRRPLPMRRAPFSGGGEGWR